MAPRSKQAFSADKAMRSPQNTPMARPDPQSVRHVGIFAFICVHLRQNSYFAVPQHKVTGGLPPVRRNAVAGLESSAGQPVKSFVLRL